MIEPGSLAAKGTTQPCFSGSGLAGNDQILMRLEPCPLGECSATIKVRTRVASRRDVPERH